MLGLTIALADSGGSLDTTYGYEPFGNTTVSGSSGTPTSLPAERMTIRAAAFRRTQNGGLQPTSRTVHT